MVVTKSFRYPKEEVKGNSGTKTTQFPCLKEEKESLTQNTIVAKWKATRYVGFLQC